MAPPSRQLLVWTLPSIAILLSFLWFKRKRSGLQSDPGETKSKNEIPAITAAPCGSDTSDKLKRSLSGIESTPIDIVMPHSVKAAKRNVPIISDQDLDKEIEKIKSMKSPFSENAGRKRIRSALSTELRKSKAGSDNAPWCEAQATPTNYDIKIETFTNITPQRKISPNNQHSEIASTVQKLNSLTLEPEKDHLVAPTAGCCSDRQSAERDSANHSPVDVMLASPSLSSISDNNSDSDSGKGCSDVATPAGDGSLSGDVPQENVIVYEFIIPQQFVGRLIGRHGAVVQEIKLKTNANILIKRHPESTKFKLCAIEGSQNDIDSALKMVRQKFPEKRYPSITLEQVHITPQIPQFIIQPDNLYLKLVEAINNDTIISHIESPVHLFLQQPTHPSYSTLNRLVNCMTTCYNQSESPILPKPIQDGTICVACFNDNWYRAIILSTNEESDMSIVQFMDFGGYCNIENTLLRQIRGDFVTIPFQAAECVLANLRISQTGENDELPKNEIQIVEQLTRGHLLQTQIVGYTPNNVPIVFVYVLLGPGNIIFLNRAVFEHGIAEWVDEFQV